MTPRPVLRWALAALLAVPAAASAQQDASLSADVRRALLAAQLTVFDDVQVDVRDGLVVLSGKVTAPAKKADAQQHAAAVPGVRHLRNDIDVLPHSPSDDELRERIARAIYRHPAFWNYAAMRHPPIHILVEHGRVTLTGVVNSHVERALARSLATGLGERSVTNALRTGADVRSE